MKIIALLVTLFVSLFLIGCNKYGAGGVANKLVGDWAQVRLPEGCTPKSIAGEEGSGVIVLCEDGRVFH